MNLPGDAELLLAARRTLLDALDALAEQREALVLIGAQAIYLHTGAAPVALAETANDSDLAVDPRTLSDSPLLDDAMTRAGFHRDPQHPQPGGWLSASGIPVDLMVPRRSPVGGDAAAPGYPRTARRLLAAQPGLRQPSSTTLCTRSSRSTNQIGAASR
jgi:hypothetical protein